MTNENSPTSLVIFGITGDLSRRKILPALFHLEQDDYLHDDVKMYGTTRREYSIDNIKKDMLEHIKDCSLDCSEEYLPKFLERINIFNLNLTSEEDFHRLADELSNHDISCSTEHNRLFYFAIPPKMIKTVIDNIVKSKSHLCGDKNLSRLLIEKPFGSDAASAQNLIDVLGRDFEEENIYRIDHYLAKETAQNILQFRFKNPMIKVLWQPENIQEIQITAAESIGIEGRKDFYESTGALKDMVQSHLLQLLALTTMDEPDNFDSNSIRPKRLDILKSLKAIELEDVEHNVVRGQYDSYREEVGNSESNIETYVAIKLEINNPKWQGVPIYLRAGKALKEKVTEVNLVFKDKDMNHPDNVLTIRIQPDEGIAVDLTVKKPGIENENQRVIMDYRYKDSGHHIKHDAYEKLLVDALRGDQTLFPTSEAVINNWYFVEPILNSWAESGKQPEIYSSGSWGPESANKLFDQNDSQWKYI